MDSFNPKASSPWLPPPYSFFHGLKPELAPPLNASKDFTFSTQGGGNDVLVDPFRSSINNVLPEDDLFATYIDMEKLEGKEANDSQGKLEGKEANGSRVDGGGGGGRRGKGRGKRKAKGENVRMQAMKREQRCRQKSQPANDVSVVEPRKAMVAEELAQLWSVDPKRAKRIMANRQSAARSKERKAQHILHLEEKVKALNSEVASLNTQIAILQREMTHLAAGRSDLELQLKTLQHEIEFYDAQTEELKMEIIRLRTAIAEMDSSTRCVKVNLTPEGQSNSFSTLHHNPLITSAQQELSLLHASQHNHMQTVDSPPLAELLQIFQVGISDENKTSSGRLLAKGESLSTSLTTGESSTISY